MQLPVEDTQIAAAMKGEGILICNEIHPARAKILSENIERMGIKNALVLNETPEQLAEHFRSALINHGGCTMFRGRHVPEE